MPGGSASAPPAGTAGSANQRSPRCSRTRSGMPRVGRAEGNDAAPIGQLRSRPGPKGDIAALLGARLPVRGRRGPRSPRLPTTRVLAGGGARCRWGRRGVRRLTAVPGSRVGGRSVRRRPRTHPRTSWTRSPTAQCLSDPEPDGTITGDNPRTLIRVRVRMPRCYGQGSPMVLTRGGPGVWA